MRATSKALVATLAIAATVPAQALAGDPLNDYEGHAERDSSTYVGFDKQAKHGKTKVAHVTAALRYTCTNGDGGLAFLQARGGLKVEQKRFSGKLSIKESPVRGGPSDASYEFAGKLGKHGRAKGTIEGELFLTSMRSRGGAPVRCYTGGLDWKAKRGADISIDEGRTASPR